MVAYTKDLLVMLITVVAVLAGLAMVSLMPSVRGEMLKMKDSFASEGRYWDSGESWSTGDPPETIGEWLHHDWTPEDENECFLAQKKLRLYWDRVKDLPAKARSCHTDVTISPKCPPKTRICVEKAIEETKGVYNDGQEGMPRAVKGEEVKIRLKPDAKPKRCPEPNWGHGAKRRILTEWAEEKLKSGEFEHCPQSKWASRPHIALKLKRGSAKDANDFDIRVCGDYVYVNSQTERLQAEREVSNRESIREEAVLVY
jgi:hypothetical protein